MGEVIFGAPFGVTWDNNNNNPLFSFYHNF
jgi:hypothetical protein